MTYDPSTDERMIALATDLGEAAATALYAVARFYRSLAEGRDYAEAYETLSDTFFGRDRDEATVRLLSLIDGRTIAVRARTEYEKTRRRDGYVNPERPGTREFVISEALLDSVGEPVPFSRMNEIYQDSRGYRLRLGGTAAAKTVADLANANPGLVPVKTKVDGKAAYLLRPGSETPTGHSDSWSPYSLKEE